MTGLLLLAQACADQPALRLLDAQVRQVVPGADKTVGYGRFVNDSDRDREVVAAAAPGVRAIEFHSTREVSGMMRMRRLESLKLAAGGALELAPGGHHLMLFGVSELTDTLPVTLTFADGEERVFDFQVVPFLRE